MIANTSFGVASVQVSRLPIGVCQIEGTYLGAAAAYLQVHDSCITPVPGAVPVYQLPLNPGAQFCETLQVSQLQIQEGLFVTISTTDGTLTQSVSTMDITVWTDKTPLALNKVGDKVTNVNQRVVWNEAANAGSTKKLYALLVTETQGNACYVVLYAEDTPNQDSPGLPLGVWKLAANGSLNLYFNELRPMSQDLTNQVLHQGCTFYITPVVPAPGGQLVLNSGYKGTMLAITN